MKPLPPKIKKTIEILIGLVNISLPALFFIQSLMALPDDYSTLKKWFPSHPFSSIFSITALYATILILFLYLYKERKQIGRLKTLGFILIVLALWVITQAILSFYILFF